MKKPYSFPDDIPGIMINSYPLNNALTQINIKLLYKDAFDISNPLNPNSKTLQKILLEKIIHELQKTTQNKIFQNYTENNTENNNPEI